ncbi:hypothetical protein [Micromonospora sp. NPDC049497]|uniref:hypothetical protein n=1 Tax=Micromonospora sp. NPDC049497 TaxID=3364273 RepID=UPI0037900A8D
MPGGVRCWSASERSPTRPERTPSAVRLARVVARWASVLAHTDPGETTVSAEDAQHLRHRVFCDTLLPGGRRCSLRADHDGPCTRLPPRF